MATSEKTTYNSSGQNTILSLLHGMWQSRCLSIIVGLKIPELLCNSDEPSISIDDIAKRSGCKSSNQLYPLMKALAHEGIGMELENRHFSKNQAMELLRRDKESSLGHMVSYFCSDEFTAAMKSLGESLIVGQPAFVLEHGMNHFQYMYEIEKYPYPEGKKKVGTSENPIGSTERRRELALNYEFAMEKVTFLRSVPDVKGIKNVLEAFPWSTCKNLMDMGGSNGCFLASILQQPGCEHVQGYLVDVPDVIDNAQANVHKLGIPKHRISFIKQDFSKPFPKSLQLQVDTIMFKNVISTIIGDQEMVVNVFRLCRCLLPIGGKLVVIDSCIPSIPDRGNNNDAVDGFQVHFANVHQLCITCGSFCSKNQWCDLLRELGTKSGYRFNKVYDTYEGGYGIFELVSIAEE